MAALGEWMLLSLRCLPNIVIWSSPLKKVQKFCPHFAHERTEYQRGCHGLSNAVQPGSGRAGPESSYSKSIHCALSFSWHQSWLLRKVYSQVVSNSKRKINTTIPLPHTKRFANFKPILPRSILTSIYASPPFSRFYLHSITSNPPAAMFRAPKYLIPGPRALHCFFSQWGSPCLKGFFLLCC